MVQKYPDVLTVRLPGGFPLTADETRLLLLNLPLWVGTFEEGDETPNFEKYNNDFMKAFDKLDKFVMGDAKTEEKTV